MSESTSGVNIKADSNGTWFTLVHNKASEMWFSINTKCSAYDPGKTWAFNYSGSTSSFTATCDGRYKLSVYGAQGGGINAWENYNGNSYYSGNLPGGKGGYTTGVMKLSIGQKLYVTVGGAAQSISSANGRGTSGGYNGGGNGGNAQDNETKFTGAPGGGGATHISTTNRGVLYNFASYKNEVIMVAGGGGGSAWQSGQSGGTGGGTSGGTSGRTNVVTLNSDCGFGKGCDGKNGTSGASSAEGTAGGGGGWSGGNSYTPIANTRYQCVSAAGGSGYINTSYLSNASTKNGERSGNGYAQIEFLGD